MGKERLVQSPKEDKIKGREMRQGRKERKWRREEGHRNGERKMYQERVARRKEEERMGGVRRAEKLETKLRKKGGRRKAAGSQRS